MQQSIQCKVDGMTCGNCALTITNYLNKKGTDAVPNASTGDVSFVIEEGLDVDSSLYGGIDNLGLKYCVVMKKKLKPIHQ
ncbi:MAG: hypothetical protein IPF62_06955 [Bacteroidetes bacterium]|nr:hypothetical protein [Bacteroidota bacterium]